MDVDTISTNMTKILLLKYMTYPSFKHNLLSSQSYSNMFWPLDLKTHSGTVFAHSLHMYHTRMHDAMLPSNAVVVDKREFHPSVSLLLRLLVWTAVCKSRASRSRILLCVQLLRSLSMHNVNTSLNPAVPRRLKFSNVSSWALAVTAVTGIIVNNREASHTSLKVELLENVKVTVGGYNHVAC